MARTEHTADIDDDERERLIGMFAVADAPPFVLTHTLHLPNVDSHGYTLDEFDPSEGFGDATVQ